MALAAFKIALVVIIFLIALILAAFLVYVLYALIAAFLSDKEERKFRRRTK